MARFRPNIVVTGPRPFEEDSWKVISIGGVVFHGRGQELSALQAVLYDCGPKHCQIKETLSTT
jgi:hypothetical protein